MLVEVRVQSLRMDRSTDKPVVILETIEGERVLPIWIGPNEASAIWSHLNDRKYERPLTHDLLASAINVAMTSFAVSEPRTTSRSRMTWAGLKK